MINWRSILAGKKEPVRPNDDFKRYKTVNKTELNNNAEFTEDKDPSTGRSFEKENTHWEKGNKDFKSDKKREESDNKHGSSIMNPDVKREGVEDHMKNNSPEKYARIGLPSSDWRAVLADFNLKKKPDGTFEVSISDIDTQPTNPEVPKAPSNTNDGQSLDKDMQGLDEASMNEIIQSPQTPPQAQSSLKSDVIEWEINKVGNLKLVGRECSKNFGIFLYDGSKLIDSEIQPKANHSWREVIPQGVWESKMSRLATSSK